MMVPAKGEELLTPRRPLDDDDEVTQYRNASAYAQSASVHTCHSVLSSSVGLMTRGKRSLNLVRREGIMTAISVVKLVHSFN